MGRLAGQVAIITGGRGRYRAGDRGGVWPRRGEGGRELLGSEREASETAAEVRSAGGEALLVKADIADDQQVRKMIAQTLEHFGRVDILVNNAGRLTYVPPTDLEGVTPEMWDDIFGVNVKGSFLCSRAVAVPMRAQGKGCIINIASTAGIRYRASSLPYGVLEGGADPPRPDAGQDTGAGDSREHDRAEPYQRNAHPGAAPECRSGAGRAREEHAAATRGRRGGRVRNCSLSCDRRHVYHGRDDRRGRRAPARIVGGHRRSPARGDCRARIDTAHHFQSFVKDRGMKKFEVLRAQLRRRIESGETIVALGAHDALSARVFEMAGYDAVYMTGHGVGASMLAWTDVGLTTMTEMVWAAKNICGAINVPLIADMDTGYGNAVTSRARSGNTSRPGVDGAVRGPGHAQEVRLHEGQGAGVEGRDGRQGARCRRRAGRPELHDLRPSDARASEGAESMYDRQQAYAAAGADLVYAEAPGNADDVREDAKRKYGKTRTYLIGAWLGPRYGLTINDVKAMGYSVVILPEIGFTVMPKGTLRRCGSS